MFTTQSTTLFSMLFKNEKTQFVTSHYLDLFIRLLSKQFFLFSYLREKANIWLNCIINQVQINQNFEFRDSNYLDLTKI